MGQEFVEAADRMIGDTAEDVAKPGRRIDLHEFAGSDEAAQDSRRLTAVIASEESPVVTAHREATQRPLRGIVVNRQIAVGAVARQCGPVLQRVRYGLS